MKTIFMETADTTADWRACFESLGPRLLLFARQWLPGIADAEDAVQEAFIRFWRKHGSAWRDQQGVLFAAVRSAALDHLRREGRRLRREQAAALENDGQSGEPFFVPPTTASGADAGELEAAVRRLPAEQREVLSLKIWGELTFAEIATALGISQNTAASRYRYALSALRKSLTPTLP